MEHTPPTLSQMKKLARILGALLLLSVVGLSALGYYLYKKQEELVSTQVALQNEKVRTASSTVRIATLSSMLNDSLDTQDALRDDLNDEKERNDDFEDQIKKINGTVGTLDKLSKLDKELLQKYSKVYFLNENYQPERVREINGRYLLTENALEYIHRDVDEFLDDLLEEATDDGVDLVVVSGYRSFDEQHALKGEYTVQYGEGANTFSADQGFSEHQLGTTIDFSSKDLNGALDGFDKTPEFEWLKKNAHKYGFILSYPDGNEFYVYEPWHWRFVGEKLARKLHREEKNFYDLDQRDINEYLVNIFD